MEARRELGPGYDEHFLDALVEKLTKHSQQMQQMQQAPQRHVSADNHVGEALALGICSLIFGIPIVAITSAAGLPALIVACAMIVGVNIAFNFRR